MGKPDGSHQSKSNAPRSSEPQGAEARARHQTHLAEQERDRRLRRGLPATKPPRVRRRK